MRRLAAVLLLVLCVPARALEEPESQRRLDRLKRVLDDGWWNDRINALYDLGELGRDGEPLLAYAADDKDWQVRLTVVHFLGKRGPATAAELGRVARGEACPYVRLSALRWLQTEGAPARATLAAVLTPEDARELTQAPDRWSTERMGKPLVIDAPEGEMTPEFFAGGLDLRVCASSERSGRRHGAADEARRAAPAEGLGRDDEDETLTPPPTGKAAAAETARVARGKAETLPAGPGRTEREEGTTAVAATEAEPRRGLELDRVNVPGDPEMMAPGPGRPEEKTAERPAADYARTGTRAAVRAELADKGSPRPPETFPQAPPAPARAEPAPERADLAPDSGTGKPEVDPVPVLIAELAAKDARRRARAADELGKRGDAARPALPALRKALSDRDRRVRASAALALGGIGAASAEAVADVRRALRDKDEDVRFSAALALQRIARAR